MGKALRTNTVGEGRDKDDGKNVIARLGESVKPINESELIPSRQAALALQDEFDQRERLSDDALVDF